MKIVFKPEAERDLIEAADWYEQKRTGLGADFVHEIGSTIDRIADMPEAYRKVRGELRRALVRRFPYAIYVLVSAGFLTVYGIIHQRRAPHVWQSRMDDTN